MHSVSQYCPITAAPFQFLHGEMKRSYFVINTKDSCALKVAKHVANYARSGVIAIAMAITALAIPALLAADGINAIIQKCKGQKPLKAQEEDFHYLFTSPMFGSYVNKMKEHVSEAMKTRPSLQALSHKEPFTHPVQTHTMALIQFILSAKETTDETLNRNFHQQLVQQLRKLIDEKQSVQSQPHLSEFVDFIESLSAFVYTGTNMTPEIVQFLDKQIPEHAKTSLSGLDTAAVPSWIKEWHTHLDNSSKFKGINEDVPRLYDPRYLGDTPTVLFEYPLANRNIKMIRTPTIVKDVHRNEKGIIDKAEIVKEFRGFLDTYKKQNKVHLYVNLMVRHGNSEATRTKAIEDLESEYPDTLRVISLAKNSDFYRQWKDFAKTSMTFDSFKDMFLSEMFKQAIDYKWSPALGGDWQAKCSKALDNIRDKHFPGCTHLTQQERRDFIEIAYTEIIEVAMETVKSDSCNISCLSCIDRAAAMLTEQFIKACRKQGKELSPQQRKEMAAIALTPSILAQNRLMQKERMERLHTAAERMLA